MAEQPLFPLSPQDLHRLKAGILEQWQQLPPEHQATIALVLIHHLVEGEYGPWTLAAIETLWKEKSPLYGKTLPITAITHADLKQTDLTESEMAQLTEDDLKRITHDVSEHYANDVFWEEVGFIARLVLAKKGLD